MVSSGAKVARSALVRTANADRGEEDGKGDGGGAGNVGAGEVLGDAERVGVDDAWGLRRRADLDQVMPSKS